MNILIVSTPNDQAAGIVAYDIVSELSKKHNVLFMTRNTPINDYNFHTEIFHESRKQKMIDKIKFKVKSNLATNPDYYFFDKDENQEIFKTKRIIDRLIKVDFKPDIIFIIFYQNFIKSKNIKELFEYYKSPVFLYLMDMAPISGGCHYSWDCKGYEHECNPCPAINSKNIMNQANLNWKHKKKMFEEVDLSVISATEWSHNQLNKSSLYKDKKKYKVLLPINKNIFKPVFRNGVREQFGLPINKKIIFFGAVSVKEKRKGFKELNDALKIFATDLSEVEKNNIHLVFAGKSIPEHITKLPFSYTSLGYLSQVDLSKAYQAADLFVSPSIEDAGPMMINQAIMCGIPVVAFKIGVALDLVISGQTGYCAIHKDSIDLAKGIRYILNLEKKEYIEMSQNCRYLGLELCHPEKQAEKFISLFKMHLEQI